MLVSVFGGSVSASPSPLRRHSFASRCGGRQLVVVAAACLPMPSSVQRRYRPGCSALPTCPTAQTRPSAWMCMCLPVPPQAQRAAPPVIFMVHGGGWRIGDKAMGRVVQEKVNRWVPKGFILISATYRMLPAASRVGAGARCRLPWWRRSSVPAPGAGIPAASSSWAIRQAPIWWPCSTPARRRPSAKGGAVAGRRGARQCRDERARRRRARHPRLYDDAFGSDPAHWAALSPFHQWTVGAPRRWMPRWPATCSDAEGRLLLNR